MSDDTDPPSVGFYYTSPGSRSPAASVFSATVFPLQVTCWMLNVDVSKSPMNQATEAWAALDGTVSDSMFKNSLQG